MTEFLMRCWRGEETLTKAFWLLYGLLGIVVAIIVFVPFLIFVPDILTSPDVLKKYGDIVNAITLPYVLFSSVCLWRCAKNTNYAIKGFLAKCLVVFSVFGCLISVVRVIGRLYS